MKIMDVFFKYRLHIPILIFFMSLMSFFSNLSFNVIVLSASFSCLSAFIYIFNKVTDAQEDEINVSGLQVNKRWHKRVTAVAAVCFLLPLPFLLSAPPLLLFYLILAGIGYSYSAPLKFFGFKKRLKDIFFVKNAVSAASWASVPTLLPVLYYGREIDGATFLAALNYFVFIFAVEVVWDIRDIEGDRAAGIKTLPIVLGVLLSKIICLVPIIIMFSWRLMHFDIHPIYLCAYGLTILSIAFIQKNSHPYFFQSLVMIWIVANILFLSSHYL
jgi:4-hydroxybenzoate polyprenyltransferase